MASRVYAFNESFLILEIVCIRVSFFENGFVWISAIFITRAVVDDKYSRRLLAVKPERQVEDRKVGHCTRELHTVQSG